MLNQALQEQNMQGIDLIDSSMSFEDNKANEGDIADLANM